MANSKSTMARLDRLEEALVHITDVLVLQSERLDEVSGRIDSVREEMRMTREALAERLDRLITVTTQERTLGIERLASIERRVEKLEEHLGR
jgi:hypothetical protein